jgi:hypothetical protein
MERNGTERNPIKNTRYIVLDFYIMIVIDLPYPCAGSSSSRSRAP